MSIYLEDDVEGSFLISASVSDIVGKPFYAWSNAGASGEISKVLVDILLDGSLLANPVTIEMGKLVEIPFNLSTIPARSQPYSITATATSCVNNATFQASTLLSKLPALVGNGTAARIDNHYGGMAYKRSEDSAWTSIFPYTYYVQWSLYWYANVSTLDEFAAMGYNMIHIVPTGDLGDTPYPWNEFEPYLDRAAELGLFFQYDVRWDPTNLTTMIDQIERLKSQPTILTWYLADEPDGKSNPINSTRIGYETIKSMDPYHPVSLALNCYDFYYSDYASGGEIILSDVYPISTNTSWSNVYDTACNATYGCCKCNLSSHKDKLTVVGGCDDCHGVFEDISDRLDHFARLDDIIGWQKTHWSAPQAFGNETFWTRYPTAAEEVVMTVLPINHGAKGIVMWDFPTTEEISSVTGRLAAVLTSELIAGFLIGQPRSSELDVVGGTRIDATVWISEQQILFMLVNLNYGDVSGSVDVILPAGHKAASIQDILWGEGEWQTNGSVLSIDGLLGLQSTILVLEKA